MNYDITKNGPATHTTLTNEIDNDKYEKIPTIADLPISERHKLYSSNAAAMMDLANAGLEARRAQGLQNVSENIYGDPTQDIFYEDYIKHPFINSVWNMIATLGSTVISTVGNVGAALSKVDAMKSGGNSPEAREALETPIWNNPVTNASTDWLKDFIEHHPLPQIQGYENMSLNERLKTPTFWGSFIQNVGFSMAAIANMKMFGPFAGAITGAMGEAAIESQDYVDQETDKKIQMLETEYKNQVDALNPNDPYYQDKRNQLDNEYLKAQEAIKSDTTKAGNQIFTANLAILTLSNLLGWGRMFGVSPVQAVTNKVKKSLANKAVNKALETGKLAEKSATKKIAGLAATKLLFEAPIEGFEEYQQGVIKDAVDSFADANEFYKTRFSTESKNVTDNLLQTYKKAFVDYIDDPQAQEEIASGYLMSVLGVPFLKYHKNNKILKIKPTLEGGIPADIYHSIRETRKQNEVIKEINTRIADDTKTNNIYKGIVQHLAFNKQIDVAAEQNDLEKYKDSVESQLIADIINFDKAGALENLRAMYQNTQISDEDLNSMYESYKYQVDPNTTFDEFKANIENNRQNVLNEIDKYLNLKLRNTLLFSHLQEDALDNTLFISRKLDYYTDRLNELLKENKDQINEVITNKAFQLDDSLEKLNTFLNNGKIKIEGEDDLNVFSHFLQSLAENKTISIIDKLNLQKKVYDMMRLQHATQIYNTELAKNLKQTSEEQAKSMAEKREQYYQAIENLDQMNQNYMAYNNLDRSTVKNFIDSVEQLPLNLRTSILNELEKDNPGISTKYNKIKLFIDNIQNELRQRADNNTVNENDLADQSTKLLADAFDQWVDNATDPFSFTSIDAFNEFIRTKTNYDQPTADAIYTGMMPLFKSANEAVDTAQFSTGISNDKQVQYGADDVTPDAGTPQYDISDTQPQFELSDANEMGEAIQNGEMQTNPENLGAQTAALLNEQQTPQASSRETKIEKDDRKQRVEQGIENLTGQQPVQSQQFTEAKIDSTREKKYVIPGMNGTLVVATESEEYTHILSIDPNDSKSGELFYEANPIVDSDAYGVSHVSSITENMFEYEGNTNGAKKVLNLKPAKVKLIGDTWTVKEKGKLGFVKNDISELNEIQPTQQPSQQQSKSDAEYEKALEHPFTDDKKNRSDLLAVSWVPSSGHQDIIFANNGWAGLTDIRSETRSPNTQLHKDFKANDNTRAIFWSKYRGKDILVKRIVGGRDDRDSTFHIIFNYPVPESIRQQITNLFADRIDVSDYVKKEKEFKDIVNKIIQILREEHKSSKQFTEQPKSDYIIPEEEFNSTDPNNLVIFNSAETSKGGWHQVNITQQWHSKIQDLGSQDIIQNAKDSDRNIWGTINGLDYVVTSVHMERQGDYRAYFFKYPVTLAARKDIEKVLNDEHNYKQQRIIIALRRNNAINTSKVIDTTEIDKKNEELKKLIKRTADDVNFATLNTNKFKIDVVNNNTFTITDVTTKQSIKIGCGEKHIIITGIASIKNPEIFNFVITDFIINRDKQIKFIEYDDSENKTQAIKDKGNIIQDFANKLELGYITGNANVSDTVNTVTYIYNQDFYNKKLTEVSKPAPVAKDASEESAPAVQTNDTTDEQIDTPAVSREEIQKQVDDPRVNAAKDTTTENENDFSNKKNVHDYYFPTITEFDTSFNKNKRTRDFETAVQKVPALAPAYDYLKRHNAFLNIDTRLRDVISIKFGIDTELERDIHEKSPDFYNRNDYRPTILIFGITANGETLLLGSLPTKNEDIAKYVGLTEYSDFIKNRYEIFNPNRDFNKGIFYDEEHIIPFKSEWIKTGKINFTTTFSSLKESITKDANGKYQTSDGRPVAWAICTNGDDVAFKCSDKRVVSNPGAVESLYTVSKGGAYLLLPTAMYQPTTHTELDIDSYIPVRLRPKTFNELTLDNSTEFGKQFNELLSIIANSELTIGKRKEALVKLSKYLLNLGDYRISFFNDEKEKVTDYDRANQIKITKPVTVEEEGKLVTKYENVWTSGVTNDEFISNVLREQLSKINPNVNINYKRLFNNPGFYIDSDTVETDLPKKDSQLTRVIANWFTLPAFNPQTQQFNNNPDETNMGNKASQNDSRGVNKPIQPVTTNQSITSQAQSIEQINEKEKIREQAIANGTFMKAPDGKTDTNLTEDQWLQVRTKAFKEWFGDWEKDPKNASKVVDENGEPLVVYHHSNDEIKEFSDSFNNYFTKFKNGTSKAIFFTGTKNPKKGTILDRKFSYPVFLNIRDVVNKQGTKDDLRAQGEDFTTTINNASEKKDGVIFKGIDDNQELNQSIYVIFSPNNIKSATNNSGKFDANSNDIYDKDILEQQSTQQVDTNSKNEFVTVNFERYKAKTNQKTLPDWTKNINWDLASIGEHFETINGTLILKVPEPLDKSQGVLIVFKHPLTEAQQTELYNRYLNVYGQGIGLTKVVEQYLDELNNQQLVQSVQQERKQLDITEIVNIAQPFPVTFDGHTFFNILQAYDYYVLNRELEYILNKCSSSKKSVLDNVREQFKYAIDLTINHNETDEGPYGTYDELMAQFYATFKTNSRTVKEAFEITTRGEGSDYYGNLGVIFDEIAKQNPEFAQHIKEIDFFKVTNNSNDDLYYYLISVLEDIQEKLLNEPIQQNTNTEQSTQQTIEQSQTSTDDDPFNFDDLDTNDSLENSVEITSEPNVNESTEDKLFKKLQVMDVGAKKNRPQIVMGFDTLNSHGIAAWLDALETLKSGHNLYNGDDTGLNKLAKLFFNKDSYNDLSEEQQDSINIKSLYPDQLIIACSSGVFNENNVTDPIDYGAINEVTITEDLNKLLESARKNSNSNDIFGNETTKRCRDDEPPF